MTIRESQKEILYPRLEISGWSEWASDLGACTLRRHLLLFYFLARVVGAALEAIAAMPWPFFRGLPYLYFSPITQFIPLLRHHLVLCLRVCAPLRGYYECASRLVYCTVIARKTPQRLGMIYPVRTCRVGYCVEPRIVLPWIELGR